MDEKELYINFDEYIRQGEPAQREKAGYWQTAIGLQAVDGLKTSDYLQNTARRHIEGEITIDEARELVNQYYITKTAHDANDEDKEEADRVSSNIVKVLSSPTFDFSTGGFQSVHRRVFEGVMKHAGEFRTYDITKKEWVLEGDTVLYLNWEDLRRAIDYDLVVQPNLATPTARPKAACYQRDARSTPTSTPTSTPASLIHTDNKNIIRLVKALGEEQLSVKMLMEKIGLKDRENFLDFSLNPSLKNGFVRLLYPDSPRHPRQKYLLTVKGLALYKELNK